MIDKFGNLCCDGCGKKMGEKHEDRLELGCPRCKTKEVLYLLVVPATEKASLDKKANSMLG